MPDRRDWSPRSGHPRRKVRIKILGNLGDAHPFDYGGFIVYELHDRGKRYLGAEFWHEPLDPRNIPEGAEEEPEYTVYAFSIEENVKRDLDWVDWRRIAEFAGLPQEEIDRMSTSEDPLERAELYRTVGDYYGFQELHSRPLHFTREEMEARWHEFA